MVPETRRIGREHLLQVVALEKACFPDDCWSAATLRGVLGRWPDSLSLGAFSGGELVGYVSASLDEPMEVHVLSIAVAPGYRRQGIASGLLSAVLHWGSIRGCSRAYLEVRVGSPSARAAYGRMGFYTEGIRSRYYEDGEAALVMVRDLPAVPTAAGVALELRKLLKGRIPRKGVVLGSGLGWLAAADEPGLAIPYGSIPGAGAAAVEGHDGKLLVNRKGDTVYLLGRRHHYQGFDGIETAVLPAALASLGVGSWLLTTSSGAVSPDLTTGDAMVITDHVNCSGCIPEPPHRAVGGAIYSRRLAARAVEIGLSLGAPVREGVFCCVSGPAYESQFEVGYLAESGVSAVSMSTVQESMALASQGCEVLGVALVTNEVAEGDFVRHSEVLRAQDTVSARQRSFLQELVRELGK